MYKSKSLFLCLGFLVVGSNAAAVSFIDKCSWDDKACLKTSAQKAIPFFVAGLPDLGMPPLDPLSLNTITINEGGLELVMNDVVVYGPGKCQIMDIEYNKDEKWLNVAFEFPFDVKGTYSAGGQLLSLSIEGNGPFNVKSDKVFITVKVEVTKSNGADGQEHFNIIKYEHTFDVQEKAHLDFQNLFNGDKEKADPVLNVLNENWKPLLQTIGKPLVSALVDDVIEDIKKFFNAVPASEIEI